MPPLFFVSPEGLPLVEKLPKPTVEETSTAWDMEELRKLSADSARKQSTPKIKDTK